MDSVPYSADRLLFSTPVLSPSNWRRSRYDKRVSALVPIHSRVERMRDSAATRTRAPTTHPYRTSSASRLLQTPRAPIPAPTASVPHAAQVSTRLGNPESDVADESGWLVVYTDGACTFNGDPDARAGVGVWFGPMDKRCACKTGTIYTFDALCVGISASGVQGARPTTVPSSWCVRYQSHARPSV